MAFCDKTREIIIPTTSPLAHTTSSFETNQHHLITKNVTTHSYQLVKNVSEISFIDAFYFDLALSFSCLDLFATLDSLQRTGGKIFHPHQ
jgi:hypothetical protein